MAKRYEQLQGMVEQLQADMEKFYDKGVKAAGTRIRKKMLELREYANQVRKEVLEIQKERDAKKKK